MKDEIAALLNNLPGKQSSFVDPSQVQYLEMMNSMSMTPSFRTKIFKIDLETGLGNEEYNSFITELLSGDSPYIFASESAKESIHRHFDHTKCALFIFVEYLEMQLEPDEPAKPEPVDYKRKLSDTEF